MKIRALLGLSVLLNVVLGAWAPLHYTSVPRAQVGVLTDNVAVTTFQEPSLSFVLPKGLTVADATPRGLAAAGQLEPFRFTIVVSSDRATLVDYETSTQRSAFGPLYSADKE
jgi:hypothetical protein